MRNRFIVLIDFSASSNHLLQFAYEWSKRIDADIVMVHSTSVLLPVMTSYESKKDLIDIANADALKKLKSLAEITLPKGASVKRLVSEKPLISQLRQILQEHYNNLVFLGINGTGLLKKIFIGSQAVRIIDSIDNLIVAMPQNADCCPHKSIRVAVQKNFPLNIFEFNKFMKFSGKEIKKIVFFSYVIPEDDRGTAEKYLKELAALYADPLLDTSYEIYEGKDELISLKKVISKRTDEFIVVQRGSRMLTDYFFRKFLINELVYEGHTPLIILP